MKKKTIEDVRKECYDIFKGEYSILSNEYINNKKPIRIKHNCGYEYEAAPVYFLRKERLCPVCTPGSKNRDSRAMEELIKRLTNGEYELVGEYIGNKKEISILHKKCGKIHKYTRCEDFIGNKSQAGRRCPYCTGKYKIPDKNYLQTRLDVIYGDNEYTVISDYTDSYTPVTIRHNKCGHEFTRSRANDFNYNVCLCTQCNKYSHVYSTEDVKKIISELDSEYTMLGEYKGCHEPFLVRHNKCGHEYNVSFTNFKYGCRCPICNTHKGTSKAEDEIYNFLKEECNVENMERNIKILNGKEIDIYLSDYNIGFEYNGDYWHSEGDKVPIGYHKNKTMLAKEKGICLYHIWEHDWLKRPEHVKKFIQNAVNLKSNKR